MRYVGKDIPNVKFMMRVRDESIPGPNPFRWEEVMSHDIFSEKRSILFSLPGAFTPTCSTYQLPGFEKMFEEFKEFGISNIYCMSVNDAFVMNAWAKSNNLVNVDVIPDGNGEFTAEMGMLIQKFNLGFGLRSWRYAAIINDNTIEHMFIEPGKVENSVDDPYGETSPENILNWLRTREVERFRGN